MLYKFGILSYPRTSRSWNLVQKFALKMCCKSWNSIYSEILQQSSLPTLSFRRKYLCLSYFYNLVNGHFAFPDVPVTLYQNPYNTRSSHAIQVFMSNLMLILILSLILTLDYLTVELSSHKCNGFNFYFII